MTHPVKHLTAPDGEPADIDLRLVPLIEALWDAGYDTIGSCQDLGESLAGYPRKAAYWRGYALIEMPYEDACRLMDRVRRTRLFRDRMHWASPGAWDVSMPILSLPGERSRALWVQVHFPADQIDDLVTVLTRKRRSSRSSDA